MAGEDGASWPTPKREQHFRESDGDYRGEKDLEGRPPLPLYAEQDMLPLLPVPTLEETCDKYLRSVRPLTTDEEFHRTEAAVREFLSLGGLGQALHSRLLARAEKRGDTSWLAQWWNQLGYLEVRDPVVFFISYFFHFSDSPLPTQRTQLGRAAALVHAALSFRRHVADGSLPPERIGAKETPLCSTAYKYLFNACRVPRRGADAVRLYDPARHHYICVARRNRFFVVHVADAAGRPLPVPVIEVQLRAVIDWAGAGAGTVPAPPVGALSALDRDRWADGRAQLLEDGNGELLEQLEGAAFLLCLDDASPVTRTEVARALWHGDGRNRWYDKSVQLVVFANGKAGMLNEHSMMDGMPVLRLADYILTRTMDGGGGTGGNGGNGGGGGGTDGTGGGSDAETMMSAGDAGALPPPRPLDLALSPAGRRMVAVAESAFDDLVTAHDVRVLCFAGYGADAIKKWGFSPDAFVQMAIQLAYHRMEGVLRAVYEPAQVRRFLHGRTACVRAVSPESAAWVAAMAAQPLVRSPRKLELLRAAAAAHVKYAGDAAMGRDADRHLLGMSLLREPGETAAFFEDPAYARSKHWCVSTSHLTHELFDGWGWGEVVPDGVGVAYMIKRRTLHFNVASLCTPGEWPERLCHYLEEALLEMRALCESEAAAAAKRVRAKL